jgi:hypothetical protein
MTTLIFGFASIDDDIDFELFSKKIFFLLFFSLSLTWHLEISVATWVISDLSEVTWGPRQDFLAQFCPYADFSNFLFIFPSTTRCHPGFTVTTT